MCSYIIVDIRKRFRIFYLLICMPFRHIFHRPDLKTSEHVLNIFAFISVLSLENRNSFNLTAPITIVLHCN